MEGVSDHLIYKSFFSHYYCMLPAEYRQDALATSTANDESIKYANRFPTKSTELKSCGTQP